MYIDFFSHFQEVFNQTFDFALQSLISDFLYRIEQLFPVPDFRQVLEEFPDSKSTRVRIEHKFFTVAHFSTSAH